jgi:hypothetical protein
MSREVHVQFWERVGVKLPGATHLIITGRSKEQLEKGVRPMVEQFLRERGLELSPEKTCVTHIEQGATSSDKTSAGRGAKSMRCLPRKTRTRSWRKSGRHFAAFGQQSRAT